MKYNFADFFSQICHNAGIKNIWILDIIDNDYFSPTPKDRFPEIIKGSDTENMCISSASLAVSQNNIATCIYPCASALIESMGPLFEFNRERIPMVITCFINDYDLSPENILVPLLRNCNFFIQIITDISDAANMVRHGIQYSLTESKVSIILVSDHLLNSDLTSDKIADSKVVVTEPTIIPYDSIIKEIAEIVNKFEKITIVCGNKSKSALEEVNELANRTNAAVIYTPELRNVIEKKVDNVCGIFGRWADPVAYNTIGDSELIIILDYSYKNLINLNKDVKIIHISPLSLTDIDPLNNHRSYCGNIKETLSLTIPFIKQKSDDSFIKKIFKNKRHYSDLIKEINGPIPKILPDLAEVIGKKIKNDTILCSEGEYAFFFQNILLHPDLSNKIFHLDELRNEGSLLSSLLGLIKNDNISEVVGMMNSEILNSHLSCFFNLMSCNKKIKILAFNNNIDEINNNSNLALLCKSIGIEYHFLVNEAEMITNVDQWYDFKNLSVIEIFLNMSDQIMVPTSSVVDFDIPERIISKVFESLNKFDIGPVLFRKGIFNESHLSMKGHSFFTNRNIFYSGIGSYYVNKKISVCIINGLYDLLHVLPGIFEAKRQCIPFLLIAFNAVADQGARFYKENFILQKIINTISGFHQIVNLKEDLNLYVGDSISEAFQLNDIAALIFQNYTNFKEKIECRIMFDPSYINSHIVPAKNLIKEVSVVINNSSNPVIFAGNNAKEYKNEILALSEYLNAPVGWTLRSKDVLDDSELGIGVLGIMSQEATKKAISESDLIILIGIEFAFTGKFNTDTKIIQFDDNALNLGLIPGVNYGVIGDIKDSLDALFEFIEKKTPKESTIELIRLYNDQYNDYITKIKEKECELNRITFEGIIVTLNETAPANSWIIADMTLPCLISSIILRGGGTRHLCYTGDNIYSTNSSAFALGIDFIEKEAPKIIISTDISFRKQVDNLRNAVNNHRNMKILVIHLSNDENKIMFSHIINKEDFTGIIIKDKIDLNEKLSFAFSLKGLVIIDVFIESFCLSTQPYSIPLLVGGHRSILEKIYSNLEKNEYNNVFGMLPSDLIENV